MNFKDFDKEVRNLFDDYFEVSNKLKVVTKNIDDISITSEGELSGKTLNASVSVSRPDALISLDKLKVKSDGRVLLECSYNTSDSAKMTLAIEDGKQEAGKPAKSFGKLGFELNNPSAFNFTTDIDVVNGPLVRSTFYRPLGAYGVAGELVCNTHLDEGLQDSKPEFSEINMGLRYIGPNYKMFVRTLDLFSAYRFSYIHNIKGNISIASQVDYRLKNNQGQKFTLACNYKHDDSLTIKGKIDSAATLSSSLIHSLNPSMKLVLSAEVDLQASSSDNHKSGVSIIIN